MAGLSSSFNNERHHVVYRFVEFISRVFLRLTLAGYGRPPMQQAGARGQHGQQRQPSNHGIVYTATGGARVLPPGTAYHSQYGNRHMQQHAQQGSHQQGISRTVPLNASELHSVYKDDYASFTKPLNPNCLFSRDCHLLHLYTLSIFF